MERPVIRRPHPIQAEDVLPAISAPGQRLMFLSPGHLPEVPGAFATDFYARLLLLPHPGGLSRMAAAVAGWCEEAAARVGFAVDQLDAAALVEPFEALPWAVVPPTVRAQLLTRAIELVAQHALELAVFDLGEVAARRLIAATRVEQARGGPTMSGLAIEHLFFGMMARKADLGPGEVIAVAPGEEEQAWQFRQTFTEPGSIWRRGVVLAPPGALPGLGLAAVAERVVVQRLARRHADPAEPRARAGGQFAPPIAAALQAGVPLLAPRLSNLMPERGASELH